MQDYSREYLKKEIKSLNTGMRDYFRGYLKKQIKSLITGVQNYSQDYGIIHRITGSFTGLWDYNGSGHQQ